MNDIAWEISHSVQARVSPSFAWGYMTNVANWDDPPAIFELNGPFASGSHGTTRMPGQEPRHWQLRDVHPPKSYTVEAQLDGAAMLFTWRFDSDNDGGTRLSQQIVLAGDNAAAYVELAQSGFAPNLGPGMSRIASSMEHAEARARRV
jgi:hypothetical protein